MDKGVEITMTEPESDSIDSDTENETVHDGRRGMGIQETLLISEHKHEASVSALYLLALTCGVGG